jgi:ubiquitin-protein ligase
MSAVRLRRLQADYERLENYVRSHPRLELIQTDGNPPERYQIQYQIKSLRQRDDRLVKVDTHLVEIALPLNYPRMPPQCRMLTPIFHPNIAPHAICIGDHWSPGETLPSIVARIGELIAYQSYNVKSPLNGEAARWTSENLDRLPLDPVSMLVEEKSTAVDASAPARGPSGPAPVAPRAAPLSASLPEPPAPAPEVITFAGIECQAALRIPRERIGQKVRCPRCKTISTVVVQDSAHEHGR